MVSFYLLTWKKNKNCVHEANSSYPVIICAVNVSGHSKVSNFHQKAIPHQAVPRCQIPMHKVLRCQVDHPSCDLTGYMEHLGESQLSVGLQRLTIHQDHGVWSVGSEEEVKESLSETSCVRWDSSDNSQCNVAWHCLFNRVSGILALNYVYCTELLTPRN